MLIFQLTGSEIIKITNRDCFKKSKCINHKIRDPSKKNSDFYLDYLFVTQSYTEKTQRATELRNQISVDLSDFSVDLSVSS